MNKPSYWSTVSLILLGRDGRDHFKISDVQYRYTPLQSANTGLKLMLMNVNNLYRTLQVISEV
jgi:hypothetical protein